MKLVYFTVLPFILFAAAVHAQGKDSLYVRSFHKRLSLSLFNLQNETQLTIRQSLTPDPNNFSPIEYTTKANNITGLECHYDKLSFRLGIKTPISEKNIETKGNTEFLNLSLRLNAKNSRIDFFAQRFRGMYDNDLDKYRKSPSDTTVYFQAPDMLLKDIRLKWYRFFNKNQRFSYMSAFSGYERQLKSAGSFFLLSSVYFVDLRSPDAFVMNEAVPFYPGWNTVNGFRGIGLSVCPGFSYNLVLFKRLTLNGMLSWGPEIQYRSIRRTDLSQRKSFTAEMSTVDGRFSIAYDMDLFYVMGYYLFDSTNYTTGGISMNRRIQVIGASLGYRFKFENKFSRWLLGNRLYQKL